MSAREAILSAVHAALGGREVDACRVTEEARELLGDPAAIRPQLMAHDLVEAFVARATSAKLIGTSVDRIAQVSEFPGAVGRYLTAQGLPAAAGTAAITRVASPRLEQLRGPFGDGAR
jgi:L-lactate dehydrogenase complex protein LldG